MKKTFTILALALATLTASAQTETTPNRMLVTSTSGSVTGYAIDKVDSISFATVEGEVKAEVAYQKYATGDADTIWVSVQRTPAASAFSIAVLPTNTANRYNTDDIIARYMEMMNSPKFYQDFSSGQLTGFDSRFAANTSYTIVTMAYDEYGVACQASRADFTTPKKPTVGTPTVTYTLDSIGATAVKMTVTPNADTKAFYWCQFEKGAAQSQFEQWGPMMGFNNIEEMVKSFSWYSYSTEQVKTWDGLSPNTDYEIYVLPVDVDGNFGDIVVIPFTTAKLGGEGVANVDITIGEFGGNATDGYYQYITFTPNDQTGLYHAMVMTKEYFDTNYTDETIMDVLKSDTNPFNPYDTYWNLYGTDNNAWGLDLSTSYYALAMAKNANDEWSPLIKKEFTTPASATRAAASAKAPAVSQRIAAAKTNVHGVAPMVKAAGMKLVNVK